MPGIWFALRKSLPCKSRPSDLIDLDSGNIDPTAQRKPPRTRRSASVGCLANFKDVIHGSKRHNTESSIFVPKIVENRAEKPNKANNNKTETGSETLIGNLTPSVIETTYPTVKGFPRFEGQFGPMLVRDFKRSVSDNSGLHRCGLSSPVCQTCGEQHKRSAVSFEEPHRLSKHRVSELVEGDSSRKIVEIICQTRQECSNNDEDEDTKIERILKVHNMQNILNWFEEYREMVKTKANKQSSNYKENNPRCLADGNELMMFYATTVSCPLGTNGSSSLCKSSHCGACTILRNGFFTRRDFIGRVGIFASCDSERALRYARNQEGKSKRNKALFVCRVIAGKIHSPVRKIELGFGAGLGFDSLAWKVGHNKIAEELIILNPRALLPCFVVIYKV